MTTQKNRVLVLDLQLISSECVRFMTRAKLWN